MSVTVLAVLAFLVYGVFRILSEDGLDLLPRGVKRVMSYSALVVLLTVHHISPSAFQDGLSQFSEWSQNRLMEPFQDVMDTLIVNQPGLPTQPAPLNPATGEMQPIP